MKTLIFLALLLAGCSEDAAWPRTDFELEGGQVVTCRWVDEHACGLTLSDCTDGNTYQCQTGVIER